MEDRERERERERKTEKQIMLQTDKQTKDSNVVIVVLNF